MRKYYQKFEVIENGALSRKRKAEYQEVKKENEGNHDYLVVQFEKNWDPKEEVFKESVSLLRHNSNSQGFDSKESAQHVANLHDRGNNENYDRI